MAPRHNLRQKWLREIKLHRPGFADLSRSRRVPTVVRLARKGYSARLIGRICNVTKSTILGMSWTYDKRIKLKGGRPEFRGRNRVLLTLPWYPHKYT